MARESVESGDVTVQNTEKIQNALDTKKGMGNMKNQIVTKITKLVKNQIVCLFGNLSI